MKTICFFLGAKSGNRAVYMEASKLLAKQAAKQKIAIVYGGAKIGLMGEVANTALDAGGQVIGVITKHLFEQGIAHNNLTQLHVVDSMQDRKKMMTTISDGFIALPGGLGTLEELFEIWNAAKINLHSKPCGLLNTDGYFDSLITFIEHVMNQGFLTMEQKKLLINHSDPTTLLSMLIKKANLLLENQLMK
jgi:hypothetical protein